MSEGTHEEWRPVVGYEGLYEVSSWGNLWRLPRRRITRCGNLSKPYPEGPMRPNGTNRMYLALQLTDACGDTRYKFVHCLVAEAFLGARPPGLCVCHCDGNSRNNHVTNLRYDTMRNNMADTIRHGTNYQSSKRYCPRGHLLEWPNLGRAALASGWRQCLACQRANSYIQYRRLDRSLLPGLADRYYDTIINYKPTEKGKKLLLADVAIIRSAVAAGVMQTELARAYGVSKTTISEIVLRKTFS